MVAHVDCVWCKLTSQILSVQISKVVRLKYLKGRNFGGKKFGVLAVFARPPNKNTAKISPLKVHINLQNNWNAKIHRTPGVAGYSLLEGLFEYST